MAMYFHASINSKKSNTLLCLNWKPIRYTKLRKEHRSTEGIGSLKLESFFVNWWHARGINPSVNTHTHIQFDYICVKLKLSYFATFAISPALLGSREFLHLQNGKWIAFRAILAVILPLFINHHCMCIGGGRWNCFYRLCAPSSAVYIIVYILL